MPWPFSCIWQKPWYWYCSILLETTMQWWISHPKRLAQNWSGIAALMFDFSPCLTPPFHSLYRNLGHYCLSSAISMRTSILQMQDFTADEWRKLPKIGKNIVTVRLPTLHFGSGPIFTKNKIRPCSLGPHRIVDSNKFKLEWSIVRSWPLAWRFPWSQG